jgi:hypothetical protein
MGIFPGQIRVVVTQKGGNKDCSFFIYIHLQKKFKT